MKFLGLAFALTLTTSVFADSFSCYSTLDMEDATKKLITVNEKTIDIEGLESRLILEVVRANIQGKKVKKCAGLDPARYFKCLNKLVPNAKEGDSVLSLHNALIQIAELEPDNKEAVGRGMVSRLDIATKVDINLKDVASGVVYVTEYGTYWPNKGVYEYFDSKGISLGRFFVEPFPRNCR